ncbi:MAG TPA: FG-GAP repeat protein [Pyrinomonadaceae bacterium]|nr:FG-GAP repeat protein [Pyrinomonadaceae bacterium]
MMAVGLLVGAVSLLSLTCWSAEATGFSRHSAEANHSIPAQTPQSHYSLVASLFDNDQKLTASDGEAFDLFGRPVAVSGSTIVVGAPFDNIGANDNQGSAYVFNRQGGSWVETQKLTASDGATFDLFGLSVAISGSTIVVGSEGDDIGGNLEQGSAYVFRRQGGSWIETQKLTVSDGASGDSFGSSVAVSGSTIVVAAILGDVGANQDQGSAHVFDLHGGSWVETQRLTASDGATFDQFGTSIAVSGSTIVVGAPFAEIGPTFEEGAAYVFNHQGGSWVETQKLIVSDPGVFDLFGQSVAVSGSIIVVGRPIGGNFDQGSAHVFSRQGQTWVETQKLTASDGAEIDFFGWSVAASGSKVVVGAPFGGTVDEGSAYVFNHQGGSWVETQRLTASEREEGDEFGDSVAVSGSTVVVGAPFGGNFNQGAAYVFGP